MEERRYLISDAAKLVAVEAHVLRYWEEELSLSIGRTELGHRYYTREDIELFRKVKRLKEEGLQLRAIRVVLQNMGCAEPSRGREPQGGTASRTAWKTAEGRREQGAVAWGAAEDRTEQGAAAWKTAEGRMESGAAAREAADGRMDGSRAGENTAERRTAGAGGRESTSENAAEGQTSLAALRTNAEKLEQFTELVQDIVEKVVRDNNEELQRRLEESMARETSYLLHMQEQQAEEHFRQLDEAIRARQKNGRYVAASKEKRHFWDRLRR